MTSCTHVDVGVGLSHPGPGTVFVEGGKYGPQDARQAALNLESPPPSPTKMKVSVTFVAAVVAVTAATEATMLKRLSRIASLW